MSAPRDEEPPRKRQRLARSCQQCRSRKVKCDQGLPCGPCIRSRDALSLSCNYRDHDPLKADMPEVNPGTSKPASVQPGLETSTGPGYAETPGLSACEKTVRELQERVRRLEDSQVNSRTLRDFKATNHPERGQGLSVEPITPRLRSTSAKVKLFGQSHWMHVAEKIQAIGSFDSEVEPAMGLDKLEFVRAFKELRTLRNAVKSHQRPSIDSPISISELGTTFLSRKECDVLVESYLRTFEKIYRILHVPTFFEEYAQFWDNARAVPQVFNVKLALVLAIGVAFTSPKQLNNNFNSLRRKAQQWIYTAQWWLSGPTEKATHNLEALQSFCLLILARQVNGLGNSPSLSPASLLSMAMQIGLHRDAQTFPTLSHFQVESRARLWATVVELYLPSLLDNSMPMLVDLGAVKARPPSNINDSDLTDGPISKASKVSSDQITDTSIQLLLLRSQKLRLRAIQILSDPRMQTTYETAVHLASQLRSACTEAAIFFQSSRAAHPEPEKTTSFHRKYIDMYLRRHVLLLHRPFVLQAQGDPRFYLSRKTCLESCMVMASYTDDLRLPSADPDDFCRLMVHGSGYLRGGLGQDVIVTLAWEVITQLREEDGPGRTAPGLPLLDPAGELARQAREPVVRRLEHIREQLFEVIALGNPSLMRSWILSVVLAHIKALEAGGSTTKAAMYGAIQECMDKCLGLLREYLAVHTSREQQPAEEFLGLSNGPEIGFEELDLDLLFGSSLSNGNFGGFEF